MTKRKAVPPAATRAERVVRAGRVIPLLLKEDDVELLKEIKATAQQVKSIRVDESYQRYEIKTKVNELIAILMSGGFVHDPAVISVRSDGSWYVVEGQQRVWAHYECKRPMRVRLVRCRNYNVERDLYLILNNKHRLTVSNTAKAWTGRSGEILRMLNESKDSALRGEIRFDTSGWIPASTVLLAFGHAMRGTLHATAGAQQVHGQLDRAIEEDPARAHKTAIMLAALLMGVFKPGTPYQLHVRALATVAHEHWCSLAPDDAWELPTQYQLRRLRSFRWDRIAPSHAVCWLPHLKEAILDRWKVNGP